MREELKRVSAPAVVVVVAHGGTLRIFDRQQVIDNNLFAGMQDAARPMAHFLPLPMCVQVNVLFSIGATVLTRPFVMPSL